MTQKTPGKHYHNGLSLLDITRTFLNDTTPNAGGMIPKRATRQLRLFPNGSILSCQPLLKWPGGKRSELSVIVPHIPKHRRYFEPFFGGGSVYFDAIATKHAYANDSHPDLMTFYQCVKQQRPDFLGLLYGFVEAWERTTIEGRNALYYRIRDRYNATTRSTIRRAVDFFLLRELAYGGMFRLNANGSFNVPFGRAYAHNKNIRTKVDYLQSDAVVNKMRWLELSTSDYTKFMSGFEFDEHDFVFVDPPYDTSFSKYGQIDFATDAQHQLADILSRFKGRFMLVCKLTPLVNSCICCTISSLFSTTNASTNSTSRVASPGNPLMY